MPAAELIGKVIGAQGGSGRRVNYREIGGPDGLLANRMPFVGNSMSAHFSMAGAYIVMSYGTVIATLQAGEKTVIDENRWGPTTGRHINLCHAWL